MNPKLGYIVWSRLPDGDGWSIATERQTSRDAADEAEALIELSKGQEVVIVTQRLSKTDAVDDDTPCLLWTSSPGRRDWQDYGCDWCTALRRLYEADGARDVIVTTEPLPLPGDAPAAIATGSYALVDALVQLAAAREVEGVYALDLQALRLDCPAWYARSDFRAWLKGSSLATWPRGEPNGYPDAFLAFGGGELCDGAGLPADVRQAIEAIARRRHLEYGVVWLSGGE